MQKYLLTFSLLWFSTGALAQNLTQKPAAPIPYKEAVSAPQLLVDDITLENAGTVESNAVRIAYNAANQEFYYLLQNGTLYQFNLGSSIHFRMADASDHGISETLGLDISSDGIFYVAGTNKNGALATNEGQVSRGVFVDGEIVWETVFVTEPYPLSNTAFDHSINGIELSPDEGTLYVNSGSRTDHGEIHSVDGLYPGERESPLTAKILRIPADTTDLVLQNDQNFLDSLGFVYAEGVRNSFDLAFDANGNLFGTENAGDRDDPEEINWLREGHHYGFPWLIGGNLTPMQFEGYDVDADPFVSTNSTAYNGGFFYNDPDYPEPPEGVTFTEGVINIGPDANNIRDPEDGVVKDAADAGLTIRSLTAHRSPLGLVFDTTNSMGGQYTGDAFVLGWTGSNDSGLLSRMGDEGDDMFHLEFTQNGDELEMKTTRIVRGLLNPIDAEIVGNKVYVLEFKTSWVNNGAATAVYEITFPAFGTNSEGEPEVAESFRLYQNYPNPFNPSTTITLDIATPGFVELEVTDVMGRSIATLARQPLSARSHTFSFDGSALSSGIYFYTLSIDGKIAETRKMMLIK